MKKQPTNHDPRRDRFTENLLRAERRRYEARLYKRLAWIIAAAGVILIFCALYGLR